MAKSYLDKDGLLYFWQKIKNQFVQDVTYDSTSKKIQKTKAGETSDVVTLATVATSGSYSDLSNKPTIPGKTSTSPKMNGTAAIGSETKYAAGDHVHPSDTSRVPTSRTVNGKALSADISLTASDVGALPDDTPVGETNQNAFSNVKVGSTTIQADAKSDTLELAAGSNITLTPDTSGDKVTIAATDTTYSDVIAGGSSGLMSGSDKTKLDGIATGANNYTHPTATAHTAAAVKVGNDASGHVVLGDALTASDVSAVPTTRKVNGKALSSDITLAASDVSAIPTSAKGAASGVCPLNASSKIDSTYLPSYVDDVIEAYARSGQTALSENWLATGSASGTVISPETGKIYVLMADTTDYAANTQFRWGGTAYVKMNDGGVSAITNAEIDTIVAA